MTLLAFDRRRLDALRASISAAIDDLARIRCDDPDAADTMRVIRLAVRTLSETCLPRVHAIVNSEAMTSYRRSDIDDRGTYQSTYSTAHDRGWEVTTDPLFGPSAPRLRSFDEVLADVRSGVLVPMAAPLDANGRAGAPYTSLAFAAANPVRLGAKDVTSNLLKFIGFMSDGLPVGWREHETVEVYYVEDARIRSSVHVLTAYDRDDGPETMFALTTQATVSGYMVIRTEDSVGDIDVRIGPGEQDPTQSATIAEQSSSTYSGMFFPDTTPDFEALPQGPRLEIPDRWTFTKSSAPMVDRWGTWNL